MRGVGRRLLSTKTWRAPIYQFDSFARRPFAGNPAAVTAGVSAATAAAIAALTGAATAEAALGEVATGTVVSRIATLKTRRPALTATTR